MPTKVYTSLVGCLLSLLTVPGLADDHESYPYYGGFNFGFSQADQDCDYYNSNCDGDDTSFSIYAGKRLYENLAVEVAYLDLGKLDNDRGLYTTTGETTGVNFSLLGILPSAKLGYLYGKVGLMAWETDYTRVNNTTRATTSSDDSGTDFTFGIGYAFVFGNRYEFRIEFERLNELDDNFNSGGSYITNLSFGGNISFQ